MGTVSHASLTADADLHEPKGAFAASAGEVYIADGAASGSFQNPITALDLIADANASINTSFTPVIRVDGTDVLSLGATYSSATGFYTRVKGLVLVSIGVTFSDNGTLSSNILSVDLPHNAAIVGPFTVFLDNVTLSSASPIQAVASASNDRVLFYSLSTDGYSSALGGNIIANDTVLIVSGMYGLSS